ncbi:hypothetical protein BZG36_05001 [Bifiguratus adelaidae]|uniref:Uncharacterized protein n=1 Tax=Bifiguratus adelaidae TaxID=1938954 RepID=A0A261XUV4_9FUNG|nr:hypothetical protein BZG36_05001 [Bifiguratus adelaidae]
MQRLARSLTTLSKRLVSPQPTIETSFSQQHVFVTRTTPSVKELAANAPLLHKPSQQTVKLTEEQIAELRRLRSQDPETWSIKRLAAKFNCSPLFVSISAPLSKEARAKLEARRSTGSETVLGYKKRIIAENRKRRRALW